jgi:6-phosphogluconolactonase
MSVRLASAAPWLLVILVLLQPAAAPRPAEARKAPDAKKLWVYIGTYTQRGSKGIYLFELDTATGKLTPRGLAAATKDPSFLAIHPSRRFLYAVGEGAKFNGKPAGAVSAFAIEPGTGKLRLLNQQSSGGAGPCHLVTDLLGEHVLVANYSGGNVAVLPIRKDGRLGEATAIQQHKGSSVNKARQEAAHAHSINLDKLNRFAFACDLGIDQIRAYRYNFNRGTLTPNDPPAARVAPGSGPRHFAFHPSGRYAYVINELASTVTAFDYDEERGVLKTTQTVSTLPRSFKGENTTAEVQVHPSGKFLYGSNRGHNSIAIFAIDAKTGKLTAVGRQGKDIKIPRNFGIDPSGKFLIVANQDGDSLVVFRIDPASGKLTPTGVKVEVPMPVCVKMMPPLKR